MEEDKAWHRSEVRAGIGLGKMTDTKWLLY